MRIYFESDSDTCLLLPLIALVSVKCERCEEIHGCSFNIGWLFWTVIFYFSDEEDSHP